MRPGEAGFLRQRWVASLFKASRASIFAAMRKTALLRAVSCSREGRRHIRTPSLGPRLKQDHLQAGVFQQPKPKHRTGTFNKNLDRQQKFAQAKPGQAKPSRIMRPFMYRFEFLGCKWNCNWTGASNTNIRRVSRRRFLGGERPASRTQVSWEPY